MSRSRRPSLAATMQKAVQPEPARPVKRAEHMLGGPAARPASTSGFYAATRAGKKKVTAALDPAAHRQLRELALALGRNGEALLIEAINDLFKKHGKPAIA
jgi:hypothetical protein